MAVYRAIYMSFWTDAKVDEDFTPEDKFFMLYALTNPHTNICGCYEVSVKQMAQETGYSRDKVEKIIERFQTVHEMIFYDKTTRELFVKNWHKYNWTISPKLDGAIQNEIIHIKNNKFRSALIRIFNERKSVLDGKTNRIDENEEDEFDHSCQSEQEEMDFGEEEQNQIELSPEVKDIVDFGKPVVIGQKTDGKVEPPCDDIQSLFNEICVSYPRLVKLTQKRKESIGARWRENGSSMDVFREVFEKMQRSDFLKGQNKQGWMATFDWAILPSNFIKILEGNYENRSNSTGGGWSAIRNEAWGGQE